MAAEEAAKWERRRLQALEEGWQLCRACGPGWRRCSPYPEAGRAPPEPAEETPGPSPGRRDDRGGPGDGGTRAVAVGRRGGDAAGEAGRGAGVGAPERDVAAPREVRPADGDGRADQGVPGPPSPLRPPAAALTRLIPPQAASPRDRPMGLFILRMAVRPGLRVLGGVRTRRDRACSGSSPPIARGIRGGVVG